MDNYNHIENAIFKVKSMAFNRDRTCIFVNAFQSGKKKEDGTYNRGWNVTLILNGNTKWNNDDLKDKYVMVKGNLTFSDEDYDDDSKNIHRHGIKHTIFVEELNEVEYITK